MSEAMTHSMPVLCLDLGGPGVIVDDTCGQVVAVAGGAEGEVVHALSDALVQLASCLELRQKLSEGARSRAREYTWEKLVGRIYGDASLT